MTDDLSDVLRGFVTAEDHAVRSSTPDPGHVSHALARRVGRRRAVRIGATTLTASVVVAGVALAAAHGLRLPQPVPPVVPVPSVSVEPSPSASATPTPSPTTSTPPGPGTLGGVIEPVPSAWSPGLFERTDASWHLVHGGFRAGDGSGRDATVLVGPDGSLTEVPDTMGGQEWTLLDWLPGTARALVQLGSGDIQLVDLGTGATVLEIPWAPRVQFVTDGTGDVLRLHLVGDADDGGDCGTEVERIPADGSSGRTVVSVSTPLERSRPLLSPDRSLVLLGDEPEAGAYPVSGTGTREVAHPYPDAPQACTAWTWVSDSEVLLQCSVNGASPYVEPTPTEYWLAGVATASGARPPAATLLAGIPDSDTETPVGAWRVGGRLVVASHVWGFTATPLETRWWDGEGNGTTPLSTTPGHLGFDVEVVGSELVGLDWGTAEAGEVALVAVDPVQGTTRTLMRLTPAPDAGPFGMAFAPAHPQFLDVGIS